MIAVTELQVLVQGREDGISVIALMLRVHRPIRSLHLVAVCRVEGDHFENPKTSKSST